MAMNDEKRLHSGWRATCDVGINPNPDSVTLLGSFHTITEFWRFFNNLGQQQPLDMLPNLINFRMHRVSIASKYAVQERLYAAGSWDLILSSKATSVNEKFIKLCLLVCCELLGTDVNGVIMMRVMDDIKVMIWTETNSTAVRENLAKYFTNDDIPSIQYFEHAQGHKLQSARKASVGPKQPVTIYNANEALSIQNTKGAKVMPSDLHSVQWSEIQRESVLYQQQLAAHQQQQSEAGPPGLTKPGSKGKLTFRPSKTQEEIEKKNKLRPAATPRKGKTDIIAKQIQRIMANIRNLYDNYYQVTFTQDLDLKLRNILNDEKCPLSMAGYDKDDNIDDDASLEPAHYDNSLGFAILKCRLLNCQHVIRLSSAKQVVSNTFRTFHDSEFKPISFKSLKSLAYRPPNKQITPRRRFKIELKFFHLLSDACSDTIYVPEQVQSVFDQANLCEYILLYYDHQISPYQSTSYHHVNSGKPTTYLRFVRGRVIANLQDLNSKSKYQMNFTYDLSKSSTPQNQILLKQNETNGGMILEHVEQNTNSSYKFYLQKEPVSNLQTKNVYYKYKLVAIKFDFVVKQSTPTLSPTFGGVNNIEQPQSNQPPPVSNQVVPGVIPTPTGPITQTLRQSLSPPQQPQQPQANPIPIVSHHTPTGPQPIPGTMAGYHTPTGPQPIPGNVQPILPTTPSQTAVITVQPPAMNAINPTSYAQFVNSPQIQAAAIQPATHPTNQYQSNITATALTAPNNMASGGIPTFPMSPGGSIGLTPANIGGHTPQQQIMNTNVYAQGPPPPTHSSPMLNTNTANIQSILGQTQMMQQPTYSSSVSNSLGGTLNSAPSMHPSYSPMDPNIGSTSMTFGNAMGNMSNSNPSNMISSLGLSNPVSPALPNMSPATHLGMPGQYGMAGQAIAHTSPGMSYVQTNQYVPPMSPATQSINSSLSSLDPQAQQFALMSGSNNAMGGYGTMLQQHNQLGLNQPQMINNINRGLMGMSNTQNQMQQINSVQQIQQYTKPNQNQNNNIVTVVNKQNRGYSNQMSGGYGGDNQMMNNNQRNNNPRNQRYGGNQNMNQNRKKQQYNNRNQNQRYQRKMRDKSHNKRLHDARTNQRIMGRGYHHQMPLSQQRKMRQNFNMNNDQQNSSNNYGGNNNNNNNNNNSNQRGRGGGSSAFGFPSNATPIPQGQLNNMNKEDKDNQQGNDTTDGEANLSLNPLSPNSDGATPTSNNTTPGGTALAGVMSPKTPTMIDHVVDRVYFIAKTQSGSRFVQEKLSDKQYFGLFFKELKCHVAELMVDNFGHYAIEALFSHCDDHQRLILVANLSNHMPQVACHKQGSFSIQAMMDTLSTAEQIKYLVDALNRDIKKIILNHSGHYVILRFLQRYDYPYSKFIHKALMQHTLDLATDHYGLRVMKASVDAGPIQEMSAVFASIVKHANTLVENQYGNYIIQHLLDLGPKEVTDTIKEKMHGKFVRYSKQKFSSNVVEKCLRHSTNELKQNIHTKDWTTVIVRELLTKAGDLISDKYGNYCLQTALQAATDHPCLLQEFEKSTKPHLDTLRENVKAKWVKLLESSIEKQKKRNQMPMSMPQHQNPSNHSNHSNQSQHQNNAPPPNANLAMNANMNQNQSNQPQQQM
eukprot:540888_1